MKENISEKSKEQIGHLLNLQQTSLEDSTMMKDVVIQLLSTTLNFYCHQQSKSHCNVREKGEIREYVSDLEAVTEASTHDFCSAEILFPLTTFEMLFHLESWSV